MPNSNCFATVEKWIQSLEGLVPLEGSIDHSSQRSYEALVDSIPDLKGHWVEAVLGLRIGSIDRAHEIVQHGSTSMDRYLHGVVHRIEGDFWNAKYWFRQVGDRELLARIGMEVMSTLEAKSVLESSKSMKLFDDQNRFAPENLVDAQAAVYGKSTSHDRVLIQQIAQAEWEAIWEILKSQSSR